MYALDCETDLFAPGYMAPRIVCTTVADLETPDDAVVHVDNVFPSSLRQGIVGANIAYDLRCALAWGWASAEEIFEAYEKESVLDIAIHERITEIQGAPRKMLSLENLARVYGVPFEKDTGTQVSYGPLLGRPLCEYSAEQIRYAKADVTATARVWNRQRARWANEVSVSDVADFGRRAFWLGLISTIGMRTDPAKVADLREATADAVARLRAAAQLAGIVRPDGTKNMKALRALVRVAYDGSPPMTAPAKKRSSAKEFVPNEKTDKVTLAESGHPVLEEFADFGEYSAVENKDLPFLLRGADEPIHTRFQFADTGRTTSSKPNLQNIRRAAGIRECFVPREGRIFIACDYAGLEICTLAQVIVSRLGLRDMADFVNANGASAVHDRVGAEILGVPMAEFLALKSAGDEKASHARGCAKVVNFGRPGGMGAETLCLYGRIGYGIDLTLDAATALIRTWERANPDGMAYLSAVRRCKRGERYDVQIPGTSVTRRQIPYCAAANTGFQGLGASVAASAGWSLAREIYSGRNGPLRDAMICNFVHDEFILDVPEEGALESAERLREIMISSAKRLLPDVAIDAEYVAMRRWSKKARSRIENGKLIPWDS